MADLRCGCGLDQVDPLCPLHGDARETNVDLARLTAAERVAYTAGYTRGSETAIAGGETPDTDGLRIVRSNLRYQLWDGPFWVRELTLEELDLLHRRAGRVLSEDAVHVDG